MASVCPNCSAANPDDEIVCGACGLTLPALSPTAENTRPELHAGSLTPRYPEVARNPEDYVADETKIDGSRARADGFRTARPPGLREMQRRVTDPSGFQDRIDHRTPTSSGFNRSGVNEVTLPKPEPAPEPPATAPAIRIGFSQDNDLVVPMPQVSSFHCVVHKVGDAYVISDAHSTNGTFVNGHPIERARVRPGDRIGLGSYELQFGREITDKFAQVSGAVGNQTQAFSVPPELLKPILLGREGDCDVVLDAPQISRHHCELMFAGAGWRVRDLGSANGTYINDRSNRIETGFVTRADVLFFGSYRFPVARLADFVDVGFDAPTDHTATQGTTTLPMDREIVTIGRGIDNDVVLDAPQISRHHARIVRTGEGFLIEDLGSANGTFIDGVRISAPTLVRSGQAISFGSYAIRLDLDRGQIQRSYRGDVLLHADNLRVEVRTSQGPKAILDGISFIAYPTEFVGLLGPSGSGKTTLLTALIGYLKPSSGRTLLNGDDLSNHYDRYRGAIGYVPQEDIIHRELTVYEALYYTAKLRLPPDTTNAEIDRRIVDVLEDLEIAETADLRIGTPERKGISGGQRKRVNLALELLTEPSLLCLDEPTSGLASEDALNVMRILRKLADGGRTILLTLHQPSLQAYRLMDNVLYIADGQEVFYGPSYPESLQYFHPDLPPNTPEADAVLADPGSVMHQIMKAKRAGEPMSSLASRYRASKYFDEFVEDRKKNRRGVAVSVSGERKKPTFSVRQWMTLCRRYFAIRVKDRIGMAILMVQAPIIALLLDAVFVSEAGGVMSRLEYTPFSLFLLVVSAIWFGCSNAAREIVAEQAVYRRERMVNLAISAYVLSKFAVLGVLCLVQCVVLLSLTYFVLDFWGNPLIHLSILWLSSLGGVGMGLLLSALVRTSEAAMATVPLLLIPQIILGGAIMPIDNMSFPVAATSNVIISRWAFEGVLHAEHVANAYELTAADLPRAVAPGLPAPPPPPNPLDHFFGTAETWLGLSYILLSVFFVALVFSVGLALRSRERS